MRRVPSLAVAFSIFTATASAQSLIPLNTGAIKKSVVSIYSGDGNQDPAARELGTGFLVSIPSKKDPTTGYYGLVTSRHMVDPVWGCLATQNPAAMYIRVNRKTYDAAKDATGVNFHQVLLTEKGQIQYLKHSSDLVDAVIIPIDFLEIKNDDVTAVALADFGTDNELKRVEIGDEIISAGLVSGNSAKKRNYPFFKFGRVSNVPNEVGVAPCGPNKTNPMNYWYINASFIPNNSGSPIFRLPRGSAVGVGNRAFLVGLQSLMIDGDIAGMTPASFIFDIIEAAHLPDADLERGQKK